MNMGDTVSRREKYILHAEDCPVYLNKDVDGTCICGLTEAKRKFERFLNLGIVVSGLILLLCLMVGCVAMPWEIASSVPERVSDGVYRGPRPDFNELRKLPIGTVFSLEDDLSAVGAERGKANKAGFVFVSWPMSESAAPSAQLLRRIVEDINGYKADGVYVHCRRGIDRTGYVVAAYRMIAEGWSFERAYREVLAHGHSEFYYSGWRASLEELDKKG